MILITVLCVLFALGLVAIWRWGHHTVVTPWDDDDTWPLPAGEATRRFIWYATVGVTAGVFSGVIMLGIGGRLVMRLLAVTAGAAAQGRVTEAEEIVGRITFGGTFGLIGFIGILGGTFLGLVYMLIRRWLPRSRWGGVTFGMLFAVLVATRMDPLRPENPDFNIVGPGWLSVLAYVFIMVGYGMLVAAIAGRYSRWLPPLRKDFKTIVKYLPGYVVWGPSAFILAVPLIGGALLTMLFARTEGLKKILSSQRTMLVGRIVGAAVGLAAAPGFVLGVVDIAAR